MVGVTSNTGDLTADSDTVQKRGRSALTDDRSMITGFDELDTDVSEAVKVKKSKDTIDEAKEKDSKGMTATDIGKVIDIVTIEEDGMYELVGHQMPRFRVGQKPQERRKQLETCRTNPLGALITKPASTSTVSVISTQSGFCDLTMAASGSETNPGVLRHEDLRQHVRDEVGSSACTKRQRHRTETKRNRRSNLLSSTEDNGNNSIETDNIISLGSSWKFSVAMGLVIRCYVSLPIRRLQSDSTNYVH